MNNCNRAKHDKLINQKYCRHMRRTETHVHVCPTALNEAQPITKIKCGSKWTMMQPVEQWCNLLSNDVFLFIRTAGLIARLSRTWEQTLRFVWTKTSLQILHPPKRHRMSIGISRIQVWWSIPQEDTSWAFHKQTQVEHDGEVQDAQNQLVPPLLSERGRGRENIMVHLSCLQQWHPPNLHWHMVGT